jgi:hypothetical protein
VGILSIVCNYSYNDGTDHGYEMEHVINDTYLVNLRIPLSMLSFSIYVYAEDISGNLDKINLSLIVLDNKAPKIETINNTDTYQNQIIDIPLVVSDNIAVSEIITEGSPVQFINNSFYGKVVDAGDYLVIITVSDSSGNSANASFIITVLPEDFDTDQDGMPDLYEMENSLNLFNRDDANLDPDNDNLTNIMEFLNGTNINDPDTDDDGMPDDWEIRYGLDPLLYSKDNDADNDGRTDFEEYLDGTDPIVRNTSDDNNYLPLFILLFAMIFVIFILLLTYIIIKRKKKEASEE